MAGESLVFNTTYRSLAAEWLGLSPSQPKKDVNTEDEEVSDKKSKQEHVFTGSTKKKHKAKLPSPCHEKFQPSVEVGEKLQRKLIKAKKRACEREKDSVNTVKKLNNIDSLDEESKADIVKKKARLDVPKDQANPKSLTIADIKKRLKDQTLSKPARKRLRRKLKALEEKNVEASAKQSTQPVQDGKDNVKKQNLIKKLSVQSEAKVKQKEIDDFSKSFVSQVSNSDSKKKHKKNNVVSGKKIKNHINRKNIEKKGDGDSSTDSESDGDEIRMAANSTSKTNKYFLDKKGTNNIIKMSPSKKKKSKKKSTFSELRNHSANTENKTSQKLNSLKGKMAGKEGTVRVVSEGEVVLKQKRKRRKTRSKQKNIKKDHRPDDKKPAYLQGKGMHRVSIKTVEGSKP